jgi:glycosyltransferase involved in cell wall biosynthesis
VASRHEVTLAALADVPEDVPPGVAHLQQFCARVVPVTLPRQPRWARVPGLVRYALEAKPPELSLLHAEALFEQVRQLTSETEYDIVQIESRMGLYLEAVPPRQRRTSVLMFQNFTFEQDRRVSQIERRWESKLRTLVNSVAMRYWEPHYAANFGCATTVSERDRELLLRANPRLRVEVIRNGVDVHGRQPLAAVPAAPALLFIGNMGYPPCADAVLYFCREILPLVRQKLGQVKLWVVGRNPRPEVLRLQGDGVQVTGRVDDVMPYYQQAGVCVVPLRAGGGTRLKILEAMALGRPVVSTTIGCEGLAVKPGEDLLVADEPAQFAAEIVRLLTDETLYRRLAANGRKLVEQNYDWGIIGDRLIEVFGALRAERAVEPSRATGELRAPSA